MSVESKVQAFPDVRGVTILYDQAMDGIMEPVVIAMSSAFAPRKPRLRPVRRS